MTLRHMSVPVEASLDRISEALPECVQQHWKQILFLERMAWSVGTNAMEFYVAVIDFCEGRCFFRTETGYYGLAYGSSPGQIEAGDKIICGRRLGTPLLLRPVGGHFRLLGHVYVHGIMDTGLWPTCENELHWIELI